jgi:hypothetical protein
MITDRFLKALLLMLAALMWTGCSKSDPVADGGGDTTDAALAQGGGESPPADASGSQTGLADSSRSASQPAAAIPETPDAALMALSDGVKAGNARVFWDFLPASYQNDVNDVAREFAGKMDKELWNGVFNVGQKTVATLKSKKSMVLSHPDLQELPLPEEARAQAYDGIVGVLDALFNSPISDLDKMKSIDMGDFVAITGGALLKQAGELAELSPQTPPGGGVEVMALRKVTVLESSGDKARVQMEFSDELERVEERDMVRVEGKWIFADIAEDWDSKIAQAKNQIAQLGPQTFAEQKPQILGGLAMAEAFINQLQMANTQQEFDMALSQIIEPIKQQAPMFMMMAAMAMQGGMEGGPALPAPATGDEVTVIVKQELDEEKISEIAKQLEAASDNADASLSLPLVDGGATEITVVPVKDVAAFAKRIEFAKVVEVNADQRTVTIELKANDD